MSVRILQGDCRNVLKTLPDESVHCVVTSPPYWGLRDYGVTGQIGLEASPLDYVDCMVSVFAETRRVLRGDGTLWLNLGDCYNAYNGGAGRLKPKDLVGVPWRVALTLQADGWWLRQDIIWAKPNPMPESVRDRCTKAHEYLFLLSKSERYYFDADAIAENIVDPSRAGKPERVNYADSTKLGRATVDPHIVIRHSTRNKRSVWTVPAKASSEAHFATFPPALIEPCILAGCPAGGLVLDPFGGAGTTGLVADRHGRDAILIELNPEYADMARKRIFNDAPLFAEVQ